MDLIDKVKKAITDSGFPLEMQMAKVLRENDWTVALGQRYVDFETGVLREMDIVAERSIGGIRINLFIECKKSDNKQLVLYAPTHDRHPHFWFHPLRYFPRIFPGKTAKEKRLSSAWAGLPFFDPEVPVSNGIIFTKGDKVEQHNDSFFNTLNGLIKNSVNTASDGYIQTNFRIMFFHIVIYDGVMYQLSDSEIMPFDLAPISYGQYKFDYRFKFPTGASGLASDLVDTARKFMLYNIIEIMQPAYLQTYLQAIEKILCGIPKKTYKGWGITMEDYTEKMMHKQAI